MQTELDEMARGILTQVTVYVDDVSIHLTSHRPNEMTHLRMALAKRGLELFEELPYLHDFMQSDTGLYDKYTNLQQRYEELSGRIY